MKNTIHLYIIRNEFNVHYLIKLFSGDIFLLHVNIVS